jgi:hypothetical protein
MLAILFGTAFISDMYSTVLFLRMGLHFVRLKSAVPLYVKQSLIIRRGCEPPPADKLHTKELQSYFIANNQREDFDSAASAAASDPSGTIGRGPKRQSKFESSVTAFFEFFNGSYNSNGQLTHFCPDNCSCGCVVASFVNPTARYV